jgi:hypothetical protein
MHSQFLERASTVGHKSRTNAPGCPLALEKMNMGFMEFPRLVRSFEME